MRHALYCWIAIIGVLAMFAIPATAQDANVKRGEFSKERDEETDGPFARRKQGDTVGTPCEVLADERLRGPLNAIANEFQRRTGNRIVLSFSPAAKVNALVEKNESGADAVFCMAMTVDGKTSLDSLAGAKKVAWKHPSGEAVWGAVVGTHSEAADFVAFVGGPTGHRLWSESPAGFTIVGGMSHAEAIDWVAKNRVAHTYPLTAARMLGELGGIREGICIDIGCGTGALDIELAKRSNLTIIGLDIDAEMKPLFDKRVSEAAFQDRIRFVAGDAQDLPFDDDYADVIVSRGTLTFIPDIGKCLREVDRVLRPGGAALLGGRCLGVPEFRRVSSEDLRASAAKTGISSIQVIDNMGQWVEIRKGIKDRGLRD